uniref:Ig-like domain-containing protein n=1 Tax=Neogobius melanostomus TaxID=47308 RepID=A0A8C6SL42_9GOBI
MMLGRIALLSLSCSSTVGLTIYYYLFGVRAKCSSSNLFISSVEDRPRNTRVTVQPQTSVREHSHVSLTCSSDASPAVQHYRWYKDDGGALTVIGNSAVLTMNASKDTTAVFCEAQNDLGTDNSTVTRLDVQYSPRNTTISRLSFGAVVENDDVTLTCSSDASPAARLYRWYKADAETDTHIRDSAVLTMKASKDTTQIFCEALNDLGTDRSAVTHLDVRYHPRNTRVTVSPSGPVLEHHIVTLECSSDANPVVQRYSWHHADGGTLIGNSALLKMNASKNIADIFCRAQNDLGTDDSSNIPLDVQFSPRIQRSSNCTEDDERIRCSCEAEGNPVPVVQWHLPGISSNHSISSEPLSVSAVRSVITVSKPLSSDLFTLLCHSSNSLGTRQQLLYAQAFQQEHIGSEAGAGVAITLLIAFVFILLALVAVLLYVVRNLHVRLRKSQSKVLALDQTPESNEFEEDTEMNIYSSVY